jgi:hypothetical protein
VSGTNRKRQLRKKDKPSPEEISRDRQWELDNPEPEDAYGPDPPVADSAELIGRLIKGQLTKAQQKAANEVVEQCREANVGPEETALAVMRHLSARRDFYVPPTGKKADSVKDDWLEAISRLVKSPSEPMSQGKAVKKALEAMEDIRKNGETSLPGFSHLKRPWWGPSLTRQTGLMSLSPLNFPVPSLLACPVLFSRLLPGVLIAWGQE